MRVQARLAHVPHVSVSAVHRVQEPESGAVAHHWEGSGAERTPTQAGAAATYQCQPVISNTCMCWKNVGP
jgi:hypothetical protein